MKSVHDVKSLAWMKGEKLQVNKVHSLKPCNTNKMYSINKMLNIIKMTITYRKKINQ